MCQADCFGVARTRFLCPGLQVCRSPDTKSVSGLLRYAQDDRAYAPDNVIRRFLLTIIALLLIPIHCFALSTDTKSPIHITSDTWAYNYKTGINEYTGHVLIIQGTTHVEADRVTTFSNAKRKIQEAVAYGIKQPAHFWTLAKTDGHLIHAYANVIKFYPGQSNVTLLQKVTLNQGENSFKGELIHYNSVDQTVTVPELAGSKAVLLYNIDSE